jgi:putative transposase
MDEAESLTNTKWECKYHVVFIPKCRRNVLYGELRRHLGEVFRVGSKKDTCCPTTCP